MKKMPSHDTYTAEVAWHALYQAALFETDRDRIPERIAEAERAILARIKELFFVTADHIEEDLILDDALYALRALRSCIRVEANAA
ncbi:MAG: hypothetical protein WA477_09150 [Candidatus Sulfotelmatobacter sp.]